MPAGWRATSDGDQEARELAFFTAVFRWLCRVGDCWVAAELLAAPTGPYVQTFEGALTEELIEKVVRSEPVRVTVRENQSVRVEIHDGWTGVFARLSETEAESLGADAGGHSRDRT